LDDVITDFDSVLYVRQGACFGAGSSEVDCRDTSGSGESIQFDAPPDTVYWVFVDGYSSQTGNFRLDVSVSPSCGDGIRDPFEQCDDGNTATGDGCDGSCRFEAQCAAIPDAEPNPETAPQQIVPACRSFLVPAASMPLGDSDSFAVDLPDGATIEAWTFVGAQGSCAPGADTVLSLWDMPVSALPSVGGCLTGAVACSDNDLANAPCSSLLFTVPTGMGGPFAIRVNNYASGAPIASYGLAVNIR
jgi:cysteine-rich repeat protein